MSQQVTVTRDSGGQSGRLTLPPGQVGSRAGSPGGVGKYTRLREPDNAGESARFTSESQRESGGRSKRAWRKAEPIKWLPGQRAKRNERDEKAVILQRWYRKHAYMYAKFGPVIFARKAGGIADFGSISYLNGTRTANFVTVSDTASTAMLSHFLEKYWALPRPDVLISVTGSAMSLQLTSQLQKVFDRGLVAAASVTKAWIFTGGHTERCHGSSRQRAW